MDQHPDQRPGINAGGHLDPTDITGPGLGRRRFLAGAVAAAAAVAAGCSDSSGDGDQVTQDSGTPTSAPGTSLPVPDLAGDPFTLGVASGDPLPGSVILWTRLAPDPLALDGAGGMPDQPVEVAWEVALDDQFTEVVAEGVATARPDHGHSVHVDASGLAAATDHHYRFRVGEWTSPVGRTRTLPDGSPERFALAVANCQMRESGAWGAFTHMAQEEVDLVLHLGDYIYEYAGAGGPKGSLPTHAVTSLADYRVRYASYKTDPLLQSAHHRFAFVTTWDDHEVANNYMGDVVPDTEGDTPEAMEARKAAAYQAWWEHLPVRLDPPKGTDFAIHRAVTVGDLARLHVLEERAESALPPCRPEPDNTTDFGDCPERTEQDRTRLGETQEAWLEGSLAEGGVTWNLLGNPVVLAGVDAGTDTPAFYLDTWDGFPQARQRLIDQLAETSNPVVLTGDYHQAMVLDVHRTPFDTSSPVVAAELMGPPISSSLFSQDISPRTPHLREQLDNHGYLTVEVTPAQLTARFRVLEDVSDPDTAVRTASTWVVAAGDPVARRA